MDEAKIKAMKAKSSARKRHLRDMNEKLKLFQAIADAAISDAARWKAEADKFKLMYEKVLNANSSKN
jgi:hypothetical protein